MERSGLKHCTNCGERLNDAYRFCPGCGTSVVLAGNEPRNEPLLEDDHTSVGNSAPSPPTVLDEYLPPFAVTAERLLSGFRSRQDFFASKEWNARLASRGNAPAPTMRALTPVAQIVMLALNARENYETVDFRDLAGKTTPLMLNLTFYDDDVKHDLERWRIVLDPDGERIHFKDVLAAEIDYHRDVGRTGSYYHRLLVTYEGFDLYSSSRRDLTVAVVRDFLGELRYVVPASVP